MIFTSSWDDGDVLDLRLADMLDRCGLRGTFYIAREHRPNRLSEGNIRSLAARHEIGAHTLSHPDLTRLGAKAKQDEIGGGKRWLEDVTGGSVAMFCYPFGAYDDETKQAVADAGFRGARTLGQFFAEPHRDPFAIRTTLQVHPALLRSSTIGDFGLSLISRKARLSTCVAVLRVGISLLSGWPCFARSLMNAAALDQASVFHLWGHSWEIEEHGMWEECEAFLRFLGQLGCCPRANGELLD
jgi:hypothetical protein